MKRVPALLAFLALLAGCTHGAPHDVLRVALWQEPKTLDPLLASNSIDGFVWRLLYEPLISADAANRPVPILASNVPTLHNGGISRDGLTITYHLWPRMRWTDGTAITSRDVAATWHAIMDPRNDVPSRHGYDDITSIATPDALTVVVRLRRPFAPFVATFFSESDQPFAVLPAEVLARSPVINRASFNAEPAVTDGPFRFVHWQHGDRITLDANPAFIFGPPHLARIDLITVPNENTAANMLRGDAVEYVLQPSITLYPQFARMPGALARFTPVNGYEAMGFNTRRAPLRDLRVRLALTYAIDKARLVRDLTFGREPVATADLPEWMWAHNAALKPLPYDPRKARALLAQAGVSLPLSLTLVTDSGNVTHQREAVMLQAMLREINVRASIKTYQGGLLYAPQAEGGIVNSGRFDLVLLPWYGGIDPDNSTELSCSGIPPNGWNVTQYCSPEMDALQRVALTQYDQATRARAYHRIEALVMRDVPFVVFWYQRQQQAISTRFRGFGPNAANESWNAWQWRLRD